MLPAGSGCLWPSAHSYRPTLTDARCFLLSLDASGRFWVHLAASPHTDCPNPGSCTMRRAASGWSCGGRCERRRAWRRPGRPGPAPPGPVPAPTARPRAPARMKRPRRSQRRIRGASDPPTPQRRPTHSLPLRPRGRGRGRGAGEWRARRRRPWPLLRRTPSLLVLPARSAPPPLKPPLPLPWAHSLLACACSISLPQPHPISAPPPLPPMHSCFQLARFLVPPFGCHNL